VGTQQPSVKWLVVFPFAWMGGGGKKLEIKKKENYVDELFMEESGSDVVDRMTSSDDIRHFRFIFISFF
jgi:hypothetical protein